MNAQLTQILEKLNTRLKDAVYFYLAADPERGLGLEKVIPNFHLVHVDASQYQKYFKEANIPYLCLEDVDQSEYKHSTHQLIKNKIFQAYFKQNSKTENIMQVFKISPAIEKSAGELKVKLLNTSGELNRLFEEKISQYELLSKLNISLPKTFLAEIGELKFEDVVAKLGNQFVIQFARGHTGSGTNFIVAEKQLIQLQEQFPKRQVRVASFVKGATYTLNACVAKNAVYMGGLSQQITGVPELTPNLGGTVGNDWQSHQHLKPETYTQIIKEVTEIGNLMRTKGYLGMFGIDVIVDENAKTWIIEINARQAASIPMYTKMQLQQEMIPLSLLHICEFLGIDYDLPADSYNQQALQPSNYSQVFLRASEECTIGTELNTGIYRLQGDNAAKNPETQETKPGTIFLDEERDKALLWQRAGYTLADSETGGILLLTPLKGKQLEKNEELTRIQLTQAAIGADGLLFPWIKEALLAIKHELINA